MLSIRRSKLNLSVFVFFSDDPSGSILIISKLTPVFLETVVPSSLVSLYTVLPSPRFAVSSPVAVYISALNPFAEFTEGSYP